MNRIVKIKDDMTPIRHDFRIYKGEDSVMKIRVPVEYTLGDNLKAYLRRNERSDKVLAKMTLAPRKEVESIVLNSYKDRKLSEDNPNEVVEVDIVNSIDVQVVDMILTAEDSNKLVTNMYQKSFHYDVFSGCDCIAYGEIDVIGAVSNREEYNDLDNVADTSNREFTDFLVLYKLERGN